MPALGAGIHVLLVGSKDVDGRNKSGHERSCFDGSCFDGSWFKVMSASIRQNLLQKIDDRRDQAITFVQQMIAIPSVTGDEAKIQKFLADYMSKIGLDVDMWETDWEELKKHPGIHTRRQGV